MTTTDVLDGLVEECREDHVGLWRIFNAVKLDLGARRAADVRLLALRIVRDLLDERGVLVGQPTSDGRNFSPWELSPDRAVERIEQECAALGRDPTIGEIAWFTSGE